MKTINAFLFSFLIFPSLVFAEVPQMITYQGRVTVDGTNFTGTGQFKFALVNGDASQTFWNNGASPVSVAVTKGLYSVRLGDTGMDAIPAAVFNNTDVRLRVWFDDGINGLQLLGPDQRIAAVGYALMSANIPDGLVTSGKLADNAVTSAKLAAGAVGNSHLSPNLANGIVPWQVASTSAQSAAANTGYLLTNAAQSLVTLPTAANMGDVVRVSGVGAGGWAVTASSDQSIMGATSPAGVLWIPRENNRNWTSVASSLDGTKLVTADYTGKLYTSTNAGASWTARESDRQWQWVTSSADGTKLAALVTYGYIYTSTDSGATWTQRASDATRYWHCIASSSDGRKLVAVVYGGQIHTSTDYGVTWTAGEITHLWVRVASSADGTKLIALTQYGQLYTSTDSGITWTPRETNRDWSAVASSADGTKLLASVNNGRIYTSADSGITWIARENNRSWRSVASSADGTKLLAGVSGGQLHISTDSGVTWTARENNRNWSIGMASSADGSKLVALDSGGQIYTSSAFSSGIQGTTAAFQYAGNGVWQPLNESLIGAGSVGSNQLAVASVQTNQIQDSAVTAAKIADGAITAADFSATLQEASIIPPGSIMPFAGPSTNIPAGWKLCDGSALKSSDFPNLYAVVGTSWGNGTTSPAGALTPFVAGVTNFNLPDLRGQFLRGVDGAIGRDPDKAARTAIAAGGATGNSVGSIQNDEFKSHSHTYGSPSATDINNGPNTSLIANGSDSYTASATGGSETRPQNAYVNYIIKL